MYFLSYKKKKTMYYQKIYFTFFPQIKKLCITDFVIIYETFLAQILLLLLYYYYFKTNRPDWTVETRARPLRRKTEINIWRHDFTITTTPKFPPHSLYINTPTRFLSVNFLILHIIATTSLSVFEFKTLAS